MSISLWTSRTASGNWYNVTYGTDPSGNGLFVAVSGSNLIMTSPNGITWTSRTAPANNFWLNVRYGTDPSGNGLFVALAVSGEKRIMTSPDGINWTLRNAAVNNNWTSVTHGIDPSGNGLFVAVANSGGRDRVMTSPNGISWTSRNAPSDNNWGDVTYGTDPSGNGLFVAVAGSGPGGSVIPSGEGQVMTSHNGITWTARNASTGNFWKCVRYGNGLFVAVAASGTGNRVMTSPDGITWTARTYAADHNWNGLTYGNGLFVAVAASGVMTSPNGINWSPSTAAVNNNWTSVTHGIDPSGNGLFVAVADIGGTDRVMTANTRSPTISNFSDLTNRFGDAPFTISVPSSNSDGSFNYTSSNSSVATIFGSTITIVDIGTSIITATQSATTDYTSGTINANLIISGERPTIISVDSSFNKTYGDASFNLGARSNSNASFNYTSSNTNVATIDSSGLVTIIGIGSATINITQASSTNYSSASATTIINVSGPISNICFLGNTPIKVDQGTFAISQLKEEIHSVEGKFIKRITATKTNDKHLICIEKHALDMNVPSQKTIITANHKIMYKGKMVKSKDLIGLVDNVYKTKYRGETLYNVLLETHETMNVNNMICETLSPENTIVQLYNILDEIPSEYHADIIVQFNNQINEKNLLSHY